MPDSADLGPLGWKAWTTKKKVLVFGCGGFVILSVLTAPFTGDSGGGETPAEVAFTETTTTETTVSETTMVETPPPHGAPDFICLDLESAQDLARAEGIEIGQTSDASGRGRNQLWDRNWTVVAQSPEIGESVPETGLSLNVLKTEEAASCLEDDPTADSTSATEAPTTSTSTTSTPLSPEEALQVDMLDAIGESNRDLDRFAEFKYIATTKGLVITWTVNNNLTSGLMLSGARRDVTDMLEVLQASGLDYENVVFEGTLELVDQLGNTSESRVVLAWYEKTTVDQINFDNFLFTNVFEAAVTSETAFIHPALS